MQTVASSLFLLVTVAMTVHAKDDISENLKLPPFKDHMYFFDITTTASVASVKNSFKDFDIDQSFKVIGENRIFVAMRSNDTAALGKLDFPSGSRVTQYPVEHIQEYLDLYGAGSGWEENYTPAPPKDTVFVFFDWQLMLPKSMSLSRFSILIREWARLYQKSHSLVKPWIYPLLSAYPLRAFFVMDISENSVQVMMKPSVDIFGGPGSLRLVVKRIVPV